MIKIVLPWIDSALLPNRNDGRKWQVTASRKKAARKVGYYAALQAGFGFDPLDPDLDHSLDIVYNPPRKPGPDFDNLARAMKPTLDGIADALGVNDYRFNPVSLRRGVPVDGGQVTVIIDDLPF